MQTFLPYADFAESASVLDYKRLGKQRVETMQIYNSMTGVTKAWGNHPMIAMWRDHPIALLHYGKVMTLEWISRGYKDNMLGWFNNALEQHLGGAFRQDINRVLAAIDNIPWLGDERLHSSHRAALLWKHLSFYQRLGWTETPKLDYYWPV